MDFKWSLRSRGLVLRSLKHRARQSLPLVGLTGPSFGLGASARRGGNLLMNIGLCSRATAPGPTCCAYRSLIRAPGCVRRAGVPPAGRAYRSLLSTASAIEDHPSAHHLISAAFGSLLKTSSLHAYLFEFIL